MDERAFLEYVAQLGREHGFTVDEWRANLAGQVHPAQVARGKRQGLVGVVVLDLLGTLALAGGLGGAMAFRDSLGPDPSGVDLNAVKAIAGVGVLLAIACFAGAVRGLLRWRARKAAFERGVVDVLEGPLQKVEVRGNAAHCYFAVKGRRFDTTRALWELLTQGAAYRLHCVADQLLSFAPVQEDPMERAEYDRVLAEFERSLNIKPSKLVK